MIHFDGAKCGTAKFAIFQEIDMPYRRPYIRIVYTDADDIERAVKESTEHYYDDFPYKILAVFRNENYANQNAVAAD